MRSFFFHYNKPASRKAGKNKATIHFNGQCMIVDDLKCSVPIFSRSRKSQPRWVIAGKANNIEIVDGIGVIK